MEIDRKNRFHGTFDLQTLTENGTVESGNWILCDLQGIPPEGITMTLRGGNFRGLKHNGVQIDPTNPPPWLIIECPHWVYPYVWQYKAPLPLAVSILEACRLFTGADGESAWLHGVEVVLSTGPELTYDQLKQAHVDWAGLPYNNNLVYWDASVQTIWATFFPGMTWDELLAAIREYDISTWAGGDTIVVEEFN